MKKLNRVIRRIVAVTISVALVLCCFVPLGVTDYSSHASTDGVVLNKSYDASTGLLTLEAYVTGETVTTTVEMANPLDIVLVLDATTSMDNDLNIATSLDDLNTLCTDYAGDYKYHKGLNRSMRWNETSETWQYYYRSEWNDITTVSTTNYVSATRYVALRSAATNFTRYVASISPESRIGVVKFGCRSSFGRDQSEILNTLTECSETGCKTIISSIASISDEFAATNIGDGIDLGATLYDDKSTNDKIMIVFTDGDPNGNTSDECVESAYNVKKTGTTVYTVGVFGSSSSNPDDFMERMSSKYPNATGDSSSEAGTPVEGTYYYSVNSSMNLNSIFNTIAKTITSGGAKITTLTSGTILRDVISQKFIYDNSNEKKTRVYTSSYIGENTWDTPVEVTDESITVSYDEETQTVDVSNFDYSANWCGKETNGGSTTYRGKKIIVTIPIKPAEGAEGETGVSTNDPGSGIIPPGEAEPISHFPIPTTDLPTDIKVTKKFEGYVPDDATFSFDASVSAYITGYLAADENNYTKAVTEAKTYDTFLLGKDGSTDVIKNVLVATDNRPSTVTITEKSVPEGYSVTISDGTDSETFVGNGSNVSKTFTVTAGMEITVTNSKATPSTVPITIKNTVTGNMGDKNKSFTYSGSYELKTASTTLSEQLKHGSSKSFAEVDYGSTFTISQTDSSGYSTKVYVNDVELKAVDGVYSFTVSEEATVEFVNDRTETIDTGVILEYLPYVIILAVVAVGTVIVIIRKRKNDDDE